MSGYNAFFDRVIGRPKVFHIEVQFSPSQLPEVRLTAERQMTFAEFRTFMVDFCACSAFPKCADHVAEEWFGGVMRRALLAYPASAKSDLENQLTEVVNVSIHSIQY